MMYLRTLLCILFLVPGLLSAQTSEFNIRTLVGDDTTPPSTPVITSVTPMSPYQIDIVWGASVDDTIVMGYRVYRDNVLLATTTETNFIDTGLTPSTTYAYTVDAFDFSFNISSTSAPLATTTLSLPPPVATTSTSTDLGTPSATAVPTLRLLEINPTKTSAVVTFSSFGPTRYTLRFGRTPQYELGTISSNIFGFEHVSELTALEPGTKYYLELTLVDGRGIGRVVATETFETMPAISSSIVQSVFGVSGRIERDDALLTWVNPSNDFETIRVVRNHLFYPQDITDGVVVYEGSGESYTDREVFLRRETYYYSIFVIAEDGRVSAPAVVQISRSVKTSEGTAISPPESEPEGVLLPLPLPIPPDTGLPQYLLPSDVFISFDSVTYTLDSLGPIPVATNVLVSIPYGAVPRHLKSILVSVYHPTNHGQITTYLLKLRADGEAYEVGFQSSVVEGEGRVVVELFDYENQSVRRLSRGVNYTESDNEWSINLAGIENSHLRWGIIGSGVGLCVLFIFLLLRRRREDNH